MKLWLFALMICYSTIQADCSKVPESIRQSYGASFYQAFSYQSIGKSIAAFAQFQSAYESAKQAGESTYRLMILEQLFVWYRLYGSSLKLFAKNPEGYDRIIGEYKRPFSKSSSAYKSEWGRTPEQAAIVREFMLGVAEAISGVLCITVGSPIVAGVGFGLFVNGTQRMFTTLSHLWSEHEKGIIELKKWEQSSTKSLSDLP